MEGLGLVWDNHLRLLLAVPERHKVSGPGAVDSGGMEHRVVIHAAGLNSMASGFDFIKRLFSDYG